MELSIIGFGSMIFTKGQKQQTPKCCQSLLIRRILHLRSLCSNSCAIVYPSWLSFIVVISSQWLLMAEGACMLAELSNLCAVICDCQRKDMQGSNHALRYLSIHENNFIRYFPGHTEKVTSLGVCPKSDLIMSTSQVNLSSFPHLLEIVGFCCLMFE